MLNFAEISGKTLEDVEKPPLQPPGTYRWTVEKIPSVETSPDKKWDFVDFTLKCVAPMENVDQEALQRFGNLTNVRQRLRFIFDKEDETAFKRTEYRLRKFCEDHLAIEGAAKMAWPKEVLAKTPSHQCLADIVWNPDKNDAENFFANIGKTAPVS